MAAIKYSKSFPPLGQYGGPAEPWPLGATTSPLVLSAHRGKGFLLVAEPIDRNRKMNLGPYGPLGSPIWPEDGQWGWRGVRVTLYPAATHGRSTRNDDTPAATPVPSRLSPPNNFSVELFGGTDPLNRRSGSEGVLELADPDGRLEYLLNYVWGGAPVTLKRGVPGTPYATWETVGRFTAANIRHDMDAKRLTLRDAGWQLSGPLHDERYGGTGGLDGDPSLTGVKKPYAAGYVGNAEPVPISSQHSVFQISFTPIFAVLALRHGGVLIDFHADYETYDELIEASIPSGYYGTCLAEGIVLPNIDITKGIRVDVIGDSEMSYGHPGPTTRAAIARRIATGRGANRLNDYSQIDANSFNRMEARHSAPVGWYWPGEISKAEALNEVLAGILGWWQVRPTGELSVGWFDDPTRGSFMNLQFGTNGMGEPRVTETSIPRAGTIIGWRKNYGPQNRDQLADGVDDETADILSKPSRFAQSMMPHVLPLYPSAVVVTLDGGFWLEADAKVEAARQQSIFSAEMNRWEWDMEIDPLADIAGRVLTLTDANRVGLGSAKPMVMAGQSAFGDGKVTLSGVGYA